MDSARSILNQLVPSLCTYTDHMREADAASLQALSYPWFLRPQWHFLSANLTSNAQSQGTAVLSEEFGRNYAQLLLEEIHRGACVDLGNQRQKSGSASHDP